MDVHVGLQVRAHREAAGLTQSDLGRSIGVTFQQVQKYERGANRISASMLSRIADTLHATEAVFFPARDAEQVLAPAAADIKGLGELARLFAAMGPSRRKMFVRLARELASESEPSD